MGKRNSQRKNASMMDLDDTDSVSSTSTAKSDLISVSGAEEVEVNKDELLDQAVEALFEKRGATREKALSAIIEAFNTNLQHEFVQNKFVTLLHQCLNSIKRGSSKEIALASHAIGLLALTVGNGEKAHEILEESFTPISQALKSPSDSLKTSSLLECLAIITFVGQNDLEGTERSMQIMWQLVHPKMGSNVVAAKPSPAMISAVVSAWGFLLTTTDGWRPNPKEWKEAIAYFSTLLEKEDRSIRIAAGEALALIFQKLGTPSEFFSGEGLVHIQGLRAKVVNQVRDLSAEAGGKGSAKKDLNNQRNLFRDILEFLEDGYSPEASTKIGSDSLSTSSWSELIQLNYLKHFLGGGFVKHMQDNEFLHDVFGFEPKKKQNSRMDLDYIKSSEKRLYKSPNSVISKARTQHLNKQRMQSQGRNAGHYVGDDHEDA